jgi:ribA/ribD-fused uncharacterized protein
MGGVFLRPPSIYRRMDMCKAILSGFSGEYLALGSYYDVKILYDGIMYNCAETAFQAQRTLDETERRSIAAWYSGSVSNYYGPPNKVTLRQDWDLVKDQKMREIVEAKFRQHPDLKQLLLGTGFRYLSNDNTWHNNEWGNCTCRFCTDKERENKLGLILMEVREKLRNERLTVPLPGGQKLFADMELHPQHPKIEVSIGTDDRIGGVIAHITPSRDGKQIVSEMYDGQEIKFPTVIMKYTIQ